ncbi:MAG: ABC transporter ATP-binding protein [Thermoleophilia bacterium]|nr:ABC transporter ATP-binding protein [Thermoleophilia bacterium]
MNASPKEFAESQALASARAESVSVVGVTKRFGSVVALSDVSLSIPEGSFFGLLGPSGCGKTTLLRILAGLERPDGGDVLFNGKSILGTPPERRPFNICFQRYALFPHLTVRENIAFGLTTRGRGRGRRRRQEIAQRVDDMLSLVGLEGLGERSPSQLSGGQAQRVGLSRALINQPRLLLLDEPLSALDRNVRNVMREELLRIQQELGTTFLLVTHDQDEALSMSSEVALMNQGRIEQVADPETLYQRPATLFAARFIGAGSFLAARAHRCEGEHVSVEVAGARFRALDAGVVEGSAATVLLRPEEIRIVTEGESRTSGIVETSAFLGSSYELTITTPLGALRLRSPQPIPPGASIAIGWEETAGICYPSDDSGGRADAT